MSGRGIQNLFQSVALSAALLSSSVQAQDADVHLAAGSEPDHGITLYGHTIQPLLNGEINPYYAENNFQRWNGIQDNLDRLFGGHSDNEVSLEMLCHGLHQASLHYSAQAEAHSNSLVQALESTVYSNANVFAFVQVHRQPDASVNRAVSMALSGENGAAYADLMKVYSGQPEGQAFVQQAFQHHADAQITSQLYGAAMQTPETCGPNGKTFSSATNLSP